MRKLSSDEMSNLEAGSWACAYRTAAFIAEFGVMTGACIETGGLACGVGVALVTSSYVDWLEACHPEMLSD